MLKKKNTRENEMRLRKDVIPVIMRYLRIGFKFKALAPVSFPPNPVNTFRGALGFQLLRISCIQRKTSRDGCRNCDLFSRCAYAKCYETSPRHIEKGYAAGNSDIPHFMVIDTGFPGLKEFEAGQEFEFHIQLFGQGIETLPYIIVAARNAGMMGFTRQRIPCDLISATEYFSKATIWSETKDELKIPEANLLQLPEPDISNKDLAEVNLKFITPVAFKDKRKGNLTLEPDFNRIIGSLMRRYSTFEASENNKVNWNFKEISMLARQVKLKKINLEPVYWQRFSTRQQQRIPIAGVIGQASYVGPVKPFAQLLKAGEIIRCGRSTSFGQGRISVEGPVINNPTYPSTVFCN
jgi:hypothetical protein